MSNATVSVSPEEMELSPQRVKWNSIDLGGTLGNVQVSVKTSKGDIKADQYGVTVLDKRITGLEVQVTTELAEVRSLDTWQKIFPSFTRVTSGPDDTVEVTLQIGRSDRANAKVLNLHPVVLGDADDSQDYNFYLAFPSEESQFTYSPNEQVKAKIVWNIYPVLTGTNAPKWGGFGSVI